MVRKIEKPEQTEIEKIADSALYLKNGIALGYGKRKTDDYRIEALKKYLFDTITQWETVETKKLKKS